MSVSPRREAQCSAVMPSPCAPLTSSPDASNERTVATSACIAASATLLPSLAACTSMPSSTAAPATVAILEYISLDHRRWQRVEIHRPRAVAEGLHLVEPEPVQHREHRVGHRRAVRGL